MKQKLVKRLLALTLTLLLVFCMSGCCGYQTTTTVNEDGTSTVTLKYIYAKNFYDSMTQDASSSDDTGILTNGDFTKSTETIGNFVYYTFSRDFSFTSFTDLQNFLSNEDSYKAALKQNSKNPSSYDDLDEKLFSKVTVDSNTFVGYLDEDGLSESKSGMVASGAKVSDDDSELYSNAYYQDTCGIRFDFSITFPSAPTASNGTINGNTVTWDLAGMSASGLLIAEVGGNRIASDVTAPKISGVKDGGIYKKVKAIAATDDMGVQTLLVNGSPVSDTTTYLGMSGDGRYKVKATDVKGNSTTVSVLIDTKNPTIKGVKNNKTYKKSVKIKVKDKYGLKKITLNGKQIKLSKAARIKVTKAGKYTIKATDKAGNRSTVKFTIK